MRDVNIDIHDLIPRSWGPIVVNTLEQLRFLGRDNLLLAADEWRHSEAAMKRALDAYRKMQQKYGGYEQKIAIQEGFYYRVKSIIQVLEENASESESKPILNPNRPRDYVALGDTVYFLAQPEDFEALNQTRFLPGKIEAIEDDDVTISLVYEKEKNSFTCDWRNNIYLSEADFKSMCEDEEYARFFYRGCCSKKDTELTIEALSLSRSLILSDSAKGEMQSAKR